MTENGRSTVPDFADEDDAPDLSQSPWCERLEAAPVKRGRPPSEAPKISTTIRLDPEVIAAFKANGPGWQSRINAALRRVAGLDT